LPKLVSGVIFLGMLALSHSVQAQATMHVDWSMLADPEAQQFEDPYRDLSHQQFESLMGLAQLQAALSGELGEGEREGLEDRAAILSRELRAQGLDPEWILAQREAVAERRRRAALANNPGLEGVSVDIAGYLLVAADMEEGAPVAYLLPNRGVCMHLPPPVPNQLVRLDIQKLPEPLGPCIAAAVRGRLASNESTATVPVFDDVVPLWSSWRMDVREVTTTEPLVPEDDQH
jgi:hypothetical protein